MKKLTCIVLFLLTALLLCSCAQEPVITDTLVASKLEAVSELTTARLTYNSLLHYEDGKIPLLTKKAFFMTYCAEVEAGIDLSAVDTAITDDTLTLTLPEPIIQSIHVIPDSIQFYNEKNALFNPETKEDAVNAIARAEADIQEKADIGQMLDTAKTQTELLTGLFADAIGERALVIHYK